MKRLVLPIPPSVNHAYENRMQHGRRKRMLTREAQAFWDEAQILALLWRRESGWTIPPEDQKILLHAWFYWPDMRNHDANNTWKVLLDALEGVLYIDDSMVLEHVCDLQIDRDNPRLEIELELGEIWTEKRKVIASRNKGKRKFNYAPH